MTDQDIFGSGFDFDIEIRIGAGAFVCGEETALMASVEGQRGEPRQKPPFPFQSGLFGKPTIINNVETLATVPAIMLQGADWFRQFGTEKAPESALPQPARSAAAITATSIPERIRFVFFMSVAPFFACPPARAARKTAGADRSCLDYNKLISF